MNIDELIGAVSGAFIGYTAPQAQQRTIMPVLPNIQPLINGAGAALGGVGVSSVGYMVGMNAVMVGGVVLGAYYAFKKGWI